MQYYFIKVGVLGEVRLASAMMAFTRGRRVVVRTERGIEVGEISAPCSDETRHRLGSTGCRIVRPTTASDELLVKRLGRYRRYAIESCRIRLKDAGSGCTLLDIDQLFDGGTIIMHFLGEVDPIADAIAKDVTDQYESIVKTKHLANLLRDGCGPDCGTSAGCGSETGCGTSCAGCDRAAR